VTEIGFYHLLSKSLERALAEILTKALERGQRALVLAPTAERVGFLDTALWTYDPNSFLPHGTKKSGAASDQPVYLTDKDENPNDARLLVLIDDATSARLGDYDRAVYLFDGNDPAAVEAARNRWRDLKSAGHALVYWQQTEKGWEKKA